eukprot:scaffold17746_cov112-Isochrysis_galbana.AAC.3
MPPPSPMQRAQPADPSARLPPIGAPRRAAGQSPPWRPRPPRSGRGGPSPSAPARARWTKAEAPAPPPPGCTRTTASHCRLGRRVCPARPGKDASAPRPRRFERAAVCAGWRWCRSRRWAPERASDQTRERHAATTVAVRRRLYSSAISPKVAPRWSFVTTAPCPPKSPEGGVNMRAGGRGGLGDDFGGEPPVNPGGLFPMSPLVPPPPPHMPLPSPHLAMPHAATAQLAELLPPPLLPALRERCLGPPAQHDGRGGTVRASTRQTPGAHHGECLVNAPVPSGAAEAKAARAAAAAARAASAAAATAAAGIWGVAVPALAERGTRWGAAEVRACAGALWAPVESMVAAAAPACVGIASASSPAINK